MNCKLGTAVCGNEYCRTTVIVTSKDAGRVYCQQCVAATKFNCESCNEEHIVEDQWCRPEGFDGVCDDCRRDE